MYALHAVVPTGRSWPPPPPPPPTHTHHHPQVRVFSIQRVSKSWNARSECIRRTYNYWLPASALGLALDGGEADAARMALLRAAWERFQVGGWAWHTVVLL